ncbi:hypothetical protein [Actinocorallia libanotica]|uniref:Uncharacterized protein n=1 Tax=Actinocorallia libanotica TaxID=46162 RepID=A0ABN1Q2C5_9ACTN
MEIARRYRRFKWPKIKVYGPRSRSDIKLLSVQELERLTVAASANPKWSAEGRPEWLQKHRTSIKSLMMTVFGTEGETAYRCMVMAVMDDRSKCNFTLDVSVGDFDRLPDVPLEEVISLAHRYLLGFPPLELDPAQKEAWRRLRRSSDG